MGSIEDISDFQNSKMMESKQEKESWNEIVHPASVKKTMLELPPKCNWIPAYTNIKPMSSDFQILNISVITFNPKDPTNRKTIVDRTYNAGDFATIKKIMLCDWDIDFFQDRSTQYNQYCVKVIVSGTWNTPPIISMN